MNEPPILPPRRAPNRLPLQSPRRSTWSQLADSRRAVFVLLFGVTGLFGIPLLWMSSKFSQSEKIVWSCLVTAYTLLLLGGAAAVCWWSINQINQALQ